MQTSEKSSKDTEMTTPTLKLSHYDSLRKRLGSINFNMLMEQIVMDFNGIGFNVGSFRLA